MAPAPSDPYTTLLDILGKYLSPILAQSVIKRALERVGTSERTLSEAELPRVIQHLEAGTKLFVAEARGAPLARELQELVGRRVLPDNATIQVEAERDISDARIRAWQIAERLGARRYTLQRVSTIVSELARNIASYTPGGTVELVVVQGRTPKLRITAKDKGPGIPNLEEIMAGRYRSRTGLGVGIVATKRLSDSFDIRTGPAGTIINVEVSL